MLRLNHQESQLSVKDDTGSIDQNRNIMDNDDTSSDLSDSENFLTKGAFLLTPATELQMERVGMICEKMSYKGPFSLTKTATGILFKFADLEDYQLTFKKGFHKVTGSRFYKKIPVPCRPQKTFTIFVFEIPEEIPEDDIRHSLYKFRTVVEVCRLPPTSSQTATVSASSSGGGGTKGIEKSNICSTEITCVTSSGCVSTSSSSPPVVRITLASLEECNILLRDGLDFYGATYFPTEPALSTSIARAGGKKTVMHNSRLLDLIATSGLRIRDFLPVFDSTGFSRIPTPVTKTVVSLLLTIHIAGERGEKLEYWFSLQKYTSKRGSDGTCYYEVGIYYGMEKMGLLLANTCVVILHSHKSGFTPLLPLYSNENRNFNLVTVCAKYIESCLNLTD